MKRTYELTVVIRVDPNEEVIQESVSQVQAWVEENELGKIINADHWGRRRLAYEIKKQREGYYVCMQAEIDPSHIDELERNLKLSSDVLRYLLIRPDGEKPTQA